MPRRPSDQPPTYRRKVVRGRAHAVVTLADSQTRRRRDYLLRHRHVPVTELYAERDTSLARSIAERCG